MTTEDNHNTFGNSGNDAFGTEEQRGRYHDQSFNSEAGSSGPHPAIPAIASNAHRHQPPAPYYYPSYHHPGDGRPLAPHAIAAGNQQSHYHHYRYDPGNDTAAASGGYLWSWGANDRHHRVQPPPPPPPNVPEGLMPPPPIVPEGLMPPPPMVPQVVNTPKVLNIAFVEYEDKKLQRQSARALAEWAVEFGLVDEIAQDPIAQGRSIFARARTAVYQQMLSDMKTRPTIGRTSTLLGFTIPPNRRPFQLFRNEDELVTLLSQYLIDHPDTKIFDFFTEVFIPFWAHASYAFRSYSTNTSLEEERYSNLFLNKLCDEYSVPPGSFSLEEVTGRRKHSLNKMITKLVISAGRTLPGRTDKIESRAKFWKRILGIVTNLTSKQIENDLGPFRVTSNLPREGDRLIAGEGYTEVLVPPLGETTLSAIKMHIISRQSHLRHYFESTGVSWGERIAPPPRFQPSTASSRGAPPQFSVVHPNSVAYFSTHSTANSSLSGYSTMANSTARNNDRHPASHVTVTESVSTSHNLGINRAFSDSMGSDLCDLSEFSGSVVDCADPPDGTTHQGETTPSANGVRATTATVAAPPDGTTHQGETTPSANGVRATTATVAAPCSDLCDLSESSGSGVDCADPPDGTTHQGETTPSANGVRATTAAPCATAVRRATETTHQGETTPSANGVRATTATVAAPCATTVRRATETTHQGETTPSANGFGTATTATERGAAETVPPASATSASSNQKRHATERGAAKTVPSASATSSSNQKRQKRAQAAVASNVNTTEVMKTSGLCGNDDEVLQWGNMPAENQISKDATLYFSASIEQHKKKKIKVGDQEEEVGCQTIVCSDCVLKWKDSLGTNRSGRYKFVHCPERNCVCEGEKLVNFKYALVKDLHPNYDFLKGEGYPLTTRCCNRMWHAAYDEKHDGDQH